MTNPTKVLTTETAILAFVDEHPQEVHLNAHYRTWAMVTPAGEPDVLCDKRTVERLLLTRCLAFGTQSFLVITEAGRLSLNTHATLNLY